MNCHLMMLNGNKLRKPVTQEERMAKGQAHIANLRAMFKK